MPSLIALDVSDNDIGEEGQLNLTAAMARIEAGRGGVQFQHADGISHELLEKARQERPTPPADVLLAQDLQTLPMWRFLNTQCKMKENLDGVVTLLAALGVQELRDFNLWSDVEIERNLERSGIPEGIRAVLRQCVDDKVRGKIAEPPSPHDDGEL